MRKFEGENLRAHIPDDDMPGWIQQLHEMNLPPGETDRILAHLNETYAKKMGIKLEKETSEPNFVYRLAEERLGRKLTEEEKRLYKADAKKILADAGPELGLDPDDIEELFKE